MSEERRHCGICRVTVAPADPHRLVRGEGIAHGSCVAKNGFRGLKNEAQAFLAELSGLAAGRQFAADAAAARRPAQFAAVLSQALRPLFVASTNGMSSRRERISAFAADASARLYCEVSLEPPMAGEKKTPVRAQKSA